MGTLGRIRGRAMGISGFVSGGSIGLGTTSNSGSFRSDGSLRLFTKAAEGRRTPGRYRGFGYFTSNAKHPGVRQPSGALEGEQNESNSETEIALE